MNIEIILIILRQEISNNFLTHFKSQTMDILAKVKVFQENTSYNELKSSIHNTTDSLRKRQACQENEGLQDGIKIAYNVLQNGTDIKRNLHNQNGILANLRQKVKFMQKELYQIQKLTTEIRKVRKKRACFLIVAYIITLLWVFFRLYFKFLP